MTTQLTVEVTFVPVEVDGVGSWSSTGRTQRYVADRIISTRSGSASGPVHTVHYGGSTKNGRRLAGFFRSTDPQLDWVRRDTMNRVNRAWQAVQRW